MRWGFFEPQHGKEGSKGEKGGNDEGMGKSELQDFSGQGKGEL